MNMNDHPFNISTLDALPDRPLFVSSHLISESNEAALIDVGYSASLEPILNALAAKNIPLSSLKYIFVTHVHLDHAGGAGALLQVLPQAKLVVHPKGVRHMIDPTKLIESTKQVYGEEVYQRLHGKITPVPADRIIAAEDNLTLFLENRSLNILDTPGHANHHYCLWDEKSRSFFTGDTFGISYKQFDSEKGAFIFPATTPTQFSPTKMRGSIEKMLQYRPEMLFLTHFGKVIGIEKLANDLNTWLSEIETAFIPLKSHPDRKALIAEEFTRLLLDKLKHHKPDTDLDTAQKFLHYDIALNASGIECWLESL